MIGKGCGRANGQEFLHYARNLSANSMGMQNAKGKEDKGDEGNMEDAVGNTEELGNTEDSDLFSAVLASKL